MGIVKTRGAARKLGPVALGRNFTSFKVRNCKRYFTIHEDLLCANSKFFKQRLHKDRKAVEGECPICHEDLDPELEDITFCKVQCGQNIHKECMEEWKRSNPRLVLRCTMCRKAWKDRTGDPIEVEEDLDPVAVQLYIDWLYSGELRLAKEEDDEDEDFHLYFLKIWKVSTTMGDEEFRYALIAKYFSAVEDDDDPGFWTISIAYAFEQEDIDSMREFVLDVFRTYNPDDWDSDWTDSFPASFLSELFATLMRSGTNEETHKELLAKHTENHYKFEDVDEWDEVEDNNESDEAEDEEEDGEDQDDGEQTSDDDRFVKPVTQKRSSARRARTIDLSSESDTES